MQGLKITTTAEFPDRRQYRRGVYSTTLGNTVRVRLNVVEDTEINKASERLGLSKSTFMRIASEAFARRVVQGDEDDGDGAQDNT